MTIASRVARKAVVVSAVADCATPSSLTASAAASRSATGILIDVLDVSCVRRSSSALIRLIAADASMNQLYHALVVHRARSQPSANRANGNELRPTVVDSVTWPSWHETNAA